MICIDVSEKPVTSIFSIEEYSNDSENNIGLLRNIGRSTCVPEHTVSHFRGQYFDSYDHNDIKSHVSALVYLVKFLTSSNKEMPFLSAGRSGEEF